MGYVYTASGNVLGSGTSGWVERGTRYQKGMCRIKRVQDVALKIVENNPEAFKYEVAIYQKLEESPSDSFLRFFGSKTVNDRQSMMALSLFQGETLSKKIQSKIGFQEMVRITKCMAAGLAHLRTLGIVHGDFKPSNVLVNADEVKIIDFGSGHFVTEKDPGMCCSYNYRSTKMVLDLPYDVEADVWALGCVVHEMVTQTPLFSLPDYKNRIDALECQLTQKEITKGEFTEKEYDILQAFDPISQRQLVEKHRCFIGIELPQEYAEKLGSTLPKKLPEAIDLASSYLNKRMMKSAFGCNLYGTQVITALADLVRGAVTWEPQSIQVIENELKKVANKPYTLTG